MLMVTANNILRHNPFREWGSCRTGIELLSSGRQIVVAKQTAAYFAFLATQEKQLSYNRL